MAPWSRGAASNSANKEGSKKILAKYSRQDNENYLEGAYRITAQLYDRVPLVTREGVNTQLKEALAEKPGATLKFEDFVDESVVKELNASGFIDKVYR